MPNRVRVLLLAQPRGVLLSAITGQAIRRGSFTSARQLTAATGAFTGGWNDHPRPFAWTKNADEIPASIKHAKTKTKGLTDTRCGAVRIPGGSSCSPHPSPRA